MSKRLFILTVLVALCLGRPLPLHAAPLGQGFTYQGQLQQAGTPVEGAVSLRFSLWDAAGSGSPPTGGTQLGATQAIANVPVSGGVFSVTLNGSGEFGATAFSGEARWLQVEVCTDSTCSSTTVLGPRQALTGAPYALGPWQMTGADLSYSQGNVGIGTSSPAHALHIKTVGPAVILEDKASPSQQAGYVAYWNGVSETGWIGYGTPGSPVMTMANARPSGDIALWSSGERLRVTSTGNVGIGTSTPASRLEVRGDVRMGSVGELFAPGSPENLRLIRGKVSSTGVALLGSGYTASRTGTGTYSITWSPSFAPLSSAAPTLTVTPESSCCFFVALVTVSTSTSAVVRIVNAANTPADATFHFTAVGPR